MVRSRFAWLAGLLAGSLAWAFAAPAAAQDKPTPAQLEAGCDAGDLDSCHKLGFALYAGEGIDQDIARAASLFVRNCETGWSRSCRNAGVMAEEGVGLPQDAARSFSYYARGCDLDDAESCMMVAQSYANGTGVEPDSALAAQVGGEACDKDVGAACRLMGYLYFDGLIADAERSERFVFYRRGCELDDAPSCMNVGMAHYFGEELEQDYPLARSYFEKACDAGIAEACNNLGVMYNVGEGVASNPGKALTYYARGCEGGEQASCIVLADVRAQCISNWTDAVIGGDYASDKPMIVTVIGKIGGDPRALFESGVDGKGVMLIEAQQACEEGDENNRADRLKEGEGAVLVWPEHDTAWYVESSQRLTDAAGAQAYLDRMCGLSDQGVMLRTVNTFTILSEYVTPID